MRLLVMYDMFLIHHWKNFEMNWEILHFIKFSLVFKKALFYHNGFWNKEHSFGRLIIHLDKPFWHIRRPETNYIKTRLLFFTKKLKVWHFLLKKCYFRIQKARFCKGICGDSLWQQNQFLRTFSSLEILFEAPRITCAFFSCSFLHHYESWKTTEKMQFC